jgi:carboxyl-terminal processing protease
MKKRLKKIAIIAVLITLPGIFVFKTADNYFEISKNLQIMSSVVHEVNTYYVDDVEPSKLLRTGIDAMLKSLDPYTDFYSESEVEDYRFMTTGQYGGVGATIGKKGEDVIISEPYEGWPAQKADLRPGDILVEIDGKQIKGKSTDDVSKLLKGAPNTELKLVIKRYGVDQLINKTLVRQEIKVKNVPYYGMINDKIGYIKYTGFRQQAADEVRDALKNLEKDHKMEGLVFDLRGNPGGLLDEAIKTVNIFTDKGQLVVFTKGKMEEGNHQYSTESEPVDTKIPVVVLVDGGSASAAEIVSGSLQDLDRVLVVGANSYGKGLVQTTRPLPYNTQMKITTSKYYIPSGRCIQKIDYAKKDDEGNAYHKPDSLKQPFKTKNGRTVYDGTGIKPDVALPRKKYADVILSLGQKQLLFDYATVYRSKHETIPPANQFKLTDGEFNDFLAYLKDKEYEYTTQTEETLKKLEKTSQDDKYYTALESDFKEMEKKLKADKREDVNKYKDDIKQILQGEIASRYYYEGGRLQASFSGDADVQEALHLLNSPTEYHTLLTQGNTKK